MSELREQVIVYFFKKNFNIYFLDPVGFSMTDDSTNVTRAVAGAFSEIY